MTGVGMAREAPTTFCATAIATSAVYWLVGGAIWLYACLAFAAAGTPPLAPGP